MTAPPAGWYPDNHNRAVLRWWDGTKWTAHTALPRQPNDWWGRWWPYIIIAVCAVGGAVMLLDYAETMFRIFS